jgi:CDP-diacylglycerol--serine O-phosphatidyltransferase
VAGETILADFRPRSRPDLPRRLTIKRSNRGGAPRGAPPAQLLYRAMVHADARSIPNTRNAPPPVSPIPVRMLVPNLITLLAICAGLTAIRLSTEGRMELAVAAIVFAALLDGIDGRVARMIKGQSKFGAELDSLADFVNFGVAPG